MMNEHIPLIMIASSVAFWFGYLYAQFQLIHLLQEASELLRASADEIVALKKRLAEEED